MADDEASEEQGLAPGYGLEYQALATVWVALELIFKHKVATQVVIEPGSQEDVEVELSARSGAGADVGALDRLVIQVKHRDGQWTPGTLKKVLGDPSRERGSRGPAPRKSARERLIEDPRQAYILVTDGKLPSALKPLRVKELLQSPGNVEPPATIWPEAEGSPSAAVAGRIRLLDDQIEKSLPLQIDRLLMTELKVPLDQLEGCRKRLQARVEARLKGKALPAWTREEIIKEVEKFGGVPSNARLLSFVPPRNYDEMLRRLEKEGFLLLVGPPGVGKTWIAQQLQYEHQQRPEPFALIPVKDPRQLREAVTSGPTLFVVEDPFGSSKREPLADRWVSELSELLDEARPNRRLLVTSRLGILRAVAGKDATAQLMKRAIRLGYEDYDEETRRKILRKKVKGGGSWHQEYARAHEDRIVAKLRAPLSLHTFASSLNLLESRKEVRLDQMLDDAAVRRIALKVQGEILGLDWDACAAAAVLWSLLMREESFSLENAIAYGELLAPEGISPEVERLVQWGEAAGYFTRERARDRAHPTAIVGLRLALGERPDVSRRVLGALVGRLMDTGQTEAAMELAVNLGTLQAGLASRVRERIRKFLHDRLLFIEDEGFVRMVHLASRWVDEQDPVLVMTRELVNEGAAPTGLSFFRPSWSRPDWSKETLEAVRASEEARAVTRRFIRLELPYRHNLWPGGLSRWLVKELRWDLSDTFQEAAEQAIEYVAQGLSELLVGALSGEVPSFEPLLERLLVRLEAVENEYETVKWYREETDDPSGTEGEDEFVDYYADLSHSLSSGISQLIQERCRREGYGWIQVHPKGDALLPHWADALKRGKPSKEEVAAFISRCLAKNRALAWKTLADLAHRELPPELLQWLESADEEELQACAWAFLRLFPPGEVHDHLERLAPGLSPEHRALLAWAFRKEKELLRKEDRVEAVTAPLLPEPQAALDACEIASRERWLERSDLEALTAADLENLERWAGDEKSELGRNAFIVLASAGRVSEARFQEELDTAEPLRRGTVLRALGQLDSPWSLTLLKKGLTDKSAQCRADAIFALARRADPEGWRLIFACAKDPSPMVREACVRAIWQAQAAGALGKLEGEAVDLLLEFIRDGYARFINEEETSYPVARAAAGALARFSALPDAHSEQLLKFVEEGRKASVDIEVHKQVLDILVDRSPPALPLRLLGLLEKLRASPPDSFGEALCHHGVWALTTHVDTHPSLQLEQLGPVAELAKHSNPDLAGPALLILGMLGHMGEEANAAVRAGATEQERELRTVLVLLSAASRDRVVGDLPLAKGLPSGHPALLLLSWFHGRSTTDKAEWERRWAQHPETRSWFKKLSQAEEWGPFVQRLLRGVFQEPFRESLQD